MSAIEMQFGELVLAYTTQFEFRWNDRGSGGKHNGAFWQPLPPAGFLALGGVGVKGYDKIDGKVAALCVRAADPSSPRPPLAAPTGYERIWKDKGTGADHNGSCWRPLAPDGYVALGDVFNKGHDTPPALSDAVCVRRDLTHEAVVGSFIWDDSGTGGDKDFGAWMVATPPAFADPTLGLIAPGSFVGVASHKPPSFDPVLNVLMLPVPVQTGTDPEQPHLDGKTMPPPRTPEVVDRVVTVPFTAVRDDERDVAWKVEHSPFYTVERRAWYTLLIFENNTTSVEQHKGDDVTVGVSTTQTETYSEKTGITVSEEVGVSFIEEAKVSMTVSVELGFEQSTSVQQLQERTVRRDLAIPPVTAAALWVASYSLQGVRSDGTRLYVPLSFEVESFVSAQYPPAATEAQKLRVIPLDGVRIARPEGAPA